VTTSRGSREHVETGPAAGVAGGTLGRRHLLGGALGGLAALPVLYSAGSAAPALAASAARPGTAPAARPGGVPAAAGDLIRGAERRYHAPLLAPGTRLVLPAGVQAVPVVDFYRRPRVAPAGSAWPQVRAADGTTVDASVIPGRGAPSRIAILSGFTEGWYELIHATGRADRVTWDASQLPVLWVYGEFGATRERPYRDRFYTLALQPMSRNPYARSTSVL
jgi:hypothetical protein